LQKYDRSFPPNKEGEIEWYDSAKEVIDAHKAADYPNATIYVYGLATRLTTISYSRVGVIGYHDFGIHPDNLELCAQNGLTNEMIWEGAFDQ
jgi:hypothetical protein